MVVHRLLRVGGPARRAHLVVDRGSWHGVGADVRHVATQVYEARCCAGVERASQKSRLCLWPIARAARGHIRCVCVAAHEAVAWQAGSAATVARICCLLGGERVACTLPADPGAGFMLQGSIIALSVPTSALARP